MDAAVGQVNRGLVKPVTIAAALIGTIEALIWTCLSLISILYYNSVILIDEDLPTTSYRRALYEIFLDDDSEEITHKLIVTPTLFSLFMYIFLVLSFVWLMSSLYMFWAMTRNKWSDGFVAIGGWAGLTIIISLFDAAIMSLVVADFVTVQDMLSSGDVTQATTETPTNSPSTLADWITTTLEPGATASISISLAADATTSPTTTDLSTDGVLGFMIDQRVALDGEYQLLKDAVYISYGIVMSLAARGYILWIVNVVFACILMKFAYDLKREEAPSLLPIMDAYASGGRAWNNLYERTDISNGYSNDAFKEDTDGSMFPRSDSFINSDSFITSDSGGKNRNPLSNGANPYEPKPVSPNPVSPNPNIVNGRVAKIGKSGGRRTPPQNVPPPSVPPTNSPYIPDPDYTPPPSPRPKSVLRPKSNYVL